MVEGKALVLNNGKKVNLIGVETSTAAESFMREMVKGRQVSAKINILIYKIIKGVFMSRGTIAISLTILLMFFNSGYSEEEIPKDGVSPAELEAIRQHNKGTESMLSEKYDEAIVYFRKAIGLNPNFTEAYYNLGITYEKLGKHRDSIEALKEAIQLDPRRANAHYALGYTYYQLKEYDDAVAAFKQSIKIKPYSAFAHSKLGHVYIVIGNEEAARKHYEILKTLDSTMASDLYREIIKGKK